MRFDQRVVKDSRLLAEKHPPSYEGGLDFFTTITLGLLLAFGVPGAELFVVRLSACCRCRRDCADGSDRHVDDGRLAAGESSSDRRSQLFALFDIHADASRGPRRSCRSVRTCPSARRARWCCRGRRCACRRPLRGPTGYRRPPPSTIGRLRRAATSSSPMWNRNAESLVVNSTGRCRHRRPMHRSHMADRYQGGRSSVPDHVMRFTLQVGPREDHGTAARRAHECRSSGTPWWLRRPRSRCASLPLSVGLFFASAARSSRRFCSAAIQRGRSDEALIGTSFSAAVSCGTTVRRSPTSGYIDRAILADRSRIPVRCRSTCGSRH